MRAGKPWHVLAVACLCLPLLAAPAGAVPTLQLDIVNPYGEWIEYDSFGNKIETTVSTSQAFSLRAILYPEGQANGDPSKVARFGDTFYISMALVREVPDGDKYGVPQSAGGDYGSFRFNNVTYDVTGDLRYGAPPIETYLGRQSGDLQKHAIFETYFEEISFLFPSGTHPLYNTQDATRTTIKPNAAYYAEFPVDVSDLDPGFHIHFDLYTVYSDPTTGKNPDPANLSIGDFAPFSHDAQSNGHEVPEPTTLILLGSGLVGLSLSIKRRPKK